MSGKGSKQRPMTVQYDLFESNWDRVFGKKEPQPLREVTHDGMWQHSCTTTLETFYIGKDEVCSWCGAWEEDGEEPPASPNWR